MDATDPEKHRKYRYQIYFTFRMPDVDAPALAEKLGIQDKVATKNLDIRFLGKPMRRSGVFHLKSAASSWDASFD